MFTAETAPTLGGCLLSRRCSSRTYASTLNTLIIGPVQYPLRQLESSLAVVPANSSRLSPSSRTNLSPSLTHRPVILFPFNMDVREYSRSEEHTSELQS